VQALEPRAGERWLDVASGTGEVALRAARAGAEVTGIDIAPVLVEQARAKAAAQGFRIAFDVGDAEALPYPDDSFDVAASNFGAVFAPDHAAVARELGRVVRPGGRLGITAWHPSTALTDLYGRHGLVAPEAADSFDWGREGHAEALLADEFELDLRNGEWELEAANGEELWELWRTGAPPFKARVDSLEPEALEAFRRDIVDYWETFREGDLVRPSREYLLILGRRR
jgi:SAM-dependent methyltransferase